MTTRGMLLIILNILSTFVGLIIGLRIIFLLVGANPSTPIIAWINNVSEVFLYPFKSLFQNIFLSSNSVIDVTAIVALLVYAILFSVLYKVVYTLTREREVIETHSHI